jgi:hypothetical protein
MNKESIRTSMYKYTGIMYGFIQIGAELWKFNNDTAEAYAKFPNGISDMNLAEEFIEGASPALAGALVGRFIYHMYTLQTKSDFRRSDEAICMGLCSYIGYSSMMYLGAYLHTVMNTPDVKWFPGT